MFSVNKFRHKSYPTSPSNRSDISLFPSHFERREKGGESFVPRCLTLAGDERYEPSAAIFHKFATVAPIGADDTRGGESSGLLKRSGTRINRDCAISREKRARAELRKGKYAIGRPNIVSRIVRLSPTECACLAFPAIVAANPVSIAFTYHRFRLVLLLPSGQKKGRKKEGKKRRRSLSIRRGLSAVKARYIWLKRCIRGEGRRGKSGSQFVRRAV